MFALKQQQPFFSDQPVMPVICRSVTTEVSVSTAGALCESQPAATAVACEKEKPDER